jgi:hypothetical protein
VVDEGTQGLQIRERAKPRRILPLAGSERSAAGMAPQNTERVKNNGVSYCQLVRINDNLRRIVDNGIQSQAPSLVANDALTGLTS